MQTILALALLAPAAGFVSSPAPKAGVAVSETKADLEAMAVKLNPVVGFYDPLGLADADFWGRGNEYTIGWLRQAEIKHGRVAMAGFVGYCLHANGVQFPLHIPGDYTTKSPAELWDQVPEAGKWQIILFVGFLEFFAESGAGGAHYTKGGKPGAFPSFNAPAGGDQYKIPHPVPLDLFDPAGLSKNASPEKKARGRLIEINNGRLAMIGLFGFLSESKVPGSVPALTKLNLPLYTGDYMAPFESNFHIF
eukprot:CAMPEP_0119259986 /NCGR_PEP_ID=MMETSP1329-20130426/577_1 /TAXON_ID=114041 /ORGANISM="Genus nov. species nov., Strain RCC1024" /LENGTH=249 /DNA_ID=CAMNT_0007259399 /DNA_START=21 /DNA_END=770 /DNA_ORIENTATION=-